MIGGYSMLDLASPTIYKEAVIAAQTKKPVMIYDLPDVYFADTITKDGTNIIVTKGGKTITIANDNTITNVGDIQPHLYRYLISLSDYKFNIDLPFKFDKISLNDGNTLTDTIKNVIIKIFDYVKITMSPLMVDDFSEIIGYYGQINNSVRAINVYYYANGADENINAIFASDFSTVSISDGSSSLSIEFDYQLF